MTDNENVKALERLASGGFDCNDGCKESKECPVEIIRETLNLINRLQEENKRLSTLAKLGNTRANDYRVMRDRALKAEAENERLNTELVGMRGAANSYKMHYDKSQAENKELWGERNRIYESLKETKLEFEEYRKAYLNAQSEIERLQKTKQLDERELSVLKINNRSLTITLSNRAKVERAEAIKEFWEKLKAEKFTHKNFGELVYVEDGDNLVKEMAYSP